MAAPHRKHLPLLAALCATLLSACVTTIDGESTRKPHEGPWLAPSAVLEQQIEDQVRRLPWTRGSERVEQIRWFAKVGEPAYGRLLELCEDPRPDVAGAAVAALGATNDSRLVDHLKRVSWPADPERGLVLERARAFVRLGDWSHVDVLIAGLRDEALWTRAWCAEALFEATRERQGFDPRADEAEREAAVKRWEAWHASRTGEGILLSKGS